MSKYFETDCSHKQTGLNERERELLLNYFYKNLHDGIRKEELVDCIDGDEDDEIVMELVEDVWKR